MRNGDVVRGLDACTLLASEYLRITLKCLHQYVWPHDATECDWLWFSLIVVFIQDALRLCAVSLDSRLYVLCTTYCVGVMCKGGGK